MYKKYSKQLKYCVLISAVLALILCTIPAYSESEPRSPRAEELEKEGSMWDPFVSDAEVYADEIFSSIGDAVVNAIVGAFSPSFNVLLNLEKGQAATDITKTYTSDDIYGSITIGTLYNFAKYFGIILANLIFFFNLFICLIGQAEQIKDSPLRLLVKYIAVLVGINISFNIILEIVNFCGGMWSDYVMTSSVGSKLDFSRDFLNNVIQYDDSGAVSTILNVSVNAYLSIVFTVVLPFIGFFLVWKLFKQFLRLFLEIAERYFVMILLLLFMPAVLATLISNHTRNIFNSYMRMFWCQVFILMCNAAFMKLFIAILMSGGWTASLMNYILALAFMRVCQRIDTYMLAMGLNVAQTGGGVIGAGINVGKMIGDLLRNINGADKLKNNIGKNMMDKALQTGDYNKFIEGEKLTRSLVGTMTGTNPSPTSELSFAQKASQTSEVVARTTTGKAMMDEGMKTGNYQMYKEGHDMSVTPLDSFTGTNNSLMSEAEFFQQSAKSYPNTTEKGTVSITDENMTFDSAAETFKIPGNVKEDLISQGVNINDIASVKQLDQGGTAFGFYDEKGRGIGYSNNGEVEVYSGREGDLYAMRADEAIAMNNTPADTQHLFDVTEGTNMHHRDSLLDNDHILKATGEDKIVSDEYYQTRSFRTGYGADKVTCTSYSLDGSFNMQSKGREYEIKAVAAHPDILKNNRYEKVKGKDGKLYGIKVSNNSPKNERTYEKNPVIAYRESKGKKS